MNNKPYVDILKRRVRHFFSSRSKYWHVRLPLNANFSEQSDNLHYPLDLSPKALYPGPFDRDGIPLLTSTESDYPYNSVTIAQYALGLYEEYLVSGDLKYLEKFRRQALWLLNTCCENKDVIFWKEGSSVFDYDLHPPWVSGMAQGEILSVLCRFYILEPDQKLHILIEKVVNGYSTPVQKGGFQVRLNEGIFFEEMPSRIPSLILNGFIFSLFGLYEAFIILNNELAYSFFAEGVSTLVKLLPKYDLNFWSLYDLYSPESTISSFYYHQLHIELLRAMNIITNESIFSEFSSKWKKYYNNPYFKGRAGLIKIKQRLDV